jgi:hypothetical protein
VTRVLPCAFALTLEFDYSQVGFIEDMFDFAIDKRTGEQLRLS